MEPFMVLQQCRMCEEVQTALYPEGLDSLWEDCTECFSCGHMTCEEIEPRAELDQVLLEEIYSEA